MPKTCPTHSDVLDAARRIEGHVTRTPVLRSAALDKIAGARLFIKAECLQETGSFKLRGASNRLLQIPETQRAGGVVAFSSGNHAQGVARAAKRLGMPAIIVMPSDAPKVKVEGVLADGAKVHAYDRHTENREEIAESLARARGAIVVPSFDDPDIIAGQGTAGLEFASQMKQRGEALDHLICCTGGGGLITGIALAFEGESPQTKIWTAEPRGHDDWRRSQDLGEIVSNAPGTRSICDAILTPEPGVLTWSIGRRLLSGGCVVTDVRVLETMRAAFTHLKIVVEPGGAVALAAALYALPPEARGKRVGVVVTGGNVDPDLYRQVLEG